MPKSRKKRTPITHSTKSRASSSRSHSSRSVIRRFHVLLKRRAQFQATRSSKELVDIENQIEEMGGLERYQQMSSIGQGSDRGGGSEKVLIKWLKDHNLNVNRHIKIKLLEVGALKPDNYGSCSSWIDCTPMDLRSRHPSILEQDFLLLNENEHFTSWDVISLSLVLNFVPEPKDRGHMLRLAHSLLVPDGYLFLALPLPCVSNSRYLNFQHLKALMTAIGFLELRDKWKEGGKMVYWLYQKRTATHISLDNFHKKVSLRNGNRRNNFCILL
ncbi:nucleolus protein [Collybia nuda]|uniref:25S rRNA adenine-N(1) methyltransferase n=1 Tax=Collybia nuda TaxID=64659 RepID=A0A9P6CBB6_9AGAR|nr:nucleolus protein [Collybia nuda]